MAEINGLQMDQFTSGFENRTHKDDVAAMQAEAIKLGITSTPTLIINGSIVRFTGKYEDLKVEIDAVVSAG